MSDIADQLRDLADELDDKKAGEEGGVLFARQGINIVEKIPCEAAGIEVFRDEDGEPFLDVKGEQLFVGHYADELIEAIKEADR